MQALPDEVMHQLSLLARTRVPGRDRIDVIKQPVAPANEHSYWDARPLHFEGSLIACCLATASKSNNNFRALL
jgi:hypothetical protein